MSQFSEVAEEDILRANLSSIADLLVDDWDWLLCLGGDERVGKSTLGIQICKAVAERTGQEFTLDNCCYDWNYLKRTAIELPNRSPLFYSESRILSRERLSHFNIAVMGALSVIGYKNHFIVINFPEFNELDPYLKNRRIKTRVEVKSYMGQRGFAHFYARVKRDHPDRRGRTVWWEYAFTYHFDKISKENGWDDNTVDLWLAYVTRDQEEKERLLKEDISDWRIGVTMRMREGGQTFKDIARALGMTERNLYRLVKGWRDGGYIVP